MRIEVVRYTKEKIPDVVAFERALRKEEAFWNWEIDENYRKKVEQSFEQSVFAISTALSRRISIGSASSKAAATAVWRSS